MKAHEYFYSLPCPPSQIGFYSVSIRSDRDWFIHENSCKNVSCSGGAPIGTVRFANPEKNKCTSGFGLFYEICDYIDMALTNDGSTNYLKRVSWKMLNNCELNGMVEYSKNNIINNLDSFSLYHLDEKNKFTEFKISVTIDPKTGGSLLSLSNINRPNSDYKIKLKLNASAVKANDLFVNTGNLVLY